MSPSPAAGDRRARVVVHFGGYAAAEGQPPPEPPTPDGPWTIEEWDGSSWVIVGNAETRAGLAEFGID